MLTLESKATQTSFAELVGCSKQAIQKLSGRIAFPRSGTHRDWLLIYCDHMRSEAGRQGGESSGDLARQRIRESEQKTLAMSLDNMARLGGLVEVEQTATVFSEFTSAVPIAINSVAEIIISGIESKHAISVDDELVHEPLRAACERLAATARKLGERIRQHRD